MAEKEIKTPELETLFMLVNAVLYEYGPRFCFTSRVWHQKSAKPHLKVFLRKSLNFRTKIEVYIEHL